MIKKYITYVNHNMDFDMIVLISDILENDMYESEIYCGKYWYIDFENIISIKINGCNLNLNNINPRNKERILGYINEELNE